MTFAEQYPFINLGKRIEEGRRLVESGFTLHQGLYKAEKGDN